MEQIFYTVYMNIILYDKLLHILNISMVFLYGLNYYVYHKLEHNVGRRVTKYGGFKDTLRRCRYKHVNRGGGAK